MAQIQKKVDKKGRISYLIRVSAGYGLDGKQNKFSMTWKAPEGMTATKAEKEVKIVAAEFERKVSSGSVLDSQIKFFEFAERYIKDYAEKNLQPKTLAEYKNRLVRINQAIGNIRLCDLKTMHINKFYGNLAEDDIKLNSKYHSRTDIPAILEERKLSLAQLAEMAAVNIHAARAAVGGNNVDMSTAEKIAAALHCNFDSLFISSSNGKLANSSIRTYHATLSAILGRAVKWGVIEVNPATHAELPKVQRKESAYLDESDARRLLELLQNEPMNYRAAITFDLLSGLRRGELLGLRWQDIDFNTDTIRVEQTSNYLPKKGMYTGTPKTELSRRSIKLAPSLFLLLREYQIWQDKQRMLLGDSWEGTDDRVFTSALGAPMHPDTLTKWFKKFTVANGFPAGIHLHSLRHTYTSLMVNGGTPLIIVSRRLGHSNVSTTSNIYSHLIQSADEKAALISDEFADAFLTEPERKKA